MSGAATSTSPLGRRDVVPYLRRRGLLAGDARVEELGGGVSNDVFAVVDGVRALVVKQS